MKESRIVKKPSPANWPLITPSHTHSQLSKAFSPHSVCRLIRRRNGKRKRERVTGKGTGRKTARIQMRTTAGQKISRFPMALRRYSAASTPHIRRRNGRRKWPGARPLAPPCCFYLHCKRSAFFKTYPFRFVFLYYGTNISFVGLHSHETHTQKEHGPSPKSDLAWSGGKSRLHDSQAFFGSRSPLLPAPRPVGTFLAIALTHQVVMQGLPSLRRQTCCPLC